jgi:hypothetical protein
MFMRRGAGLLLAGAALLAPPAPLAAQGNPSFAPRPAPACRSWLITEAGTRVRLTDRFADEQDLFFHYALGWMHSVGPRTALGLEAFGGSDGHARGGAAVRARQWLSDRVAADLVAGVHLMGNASSQEVKAGSPSFQVRVGYADRLAVIGSVDILSLRCPEFCEFIREPNTTRTRAYLGVELGSGLGVFGFAITAAGVLVAAMLYDGG